LSNQDHLQLVDQFFCQSPARAREESQIAPQASAGHSSP
jgi:hypothetical protein